jgi:hypothetical protein
MKTQFKITFFSLSSNFVRRSKNKIKTLVTYIVLPTLNKFSPIKFTLFCLYYMVVVKSEGSIIKLPGFESWLSHFLK